MHAAIATLEANAQTISAQTATDIVAEFPAIYGPNGHEIALRFILAGLNAFLTDLKQNTNSVFAQHWQQVTADRAERGILADVIMRTIEIFKQHIDAVITSTYSDNVAVQAWWFQRSDAIVLHGMMTLSRAFVVAYDRIVHEQEAKIRAMSTPVIPLHTGILLLPLVGAIDPDRVSHITETLLARISAEQASVVIIDITGVPVVDTAVGNYLIQATRAARLLGTHVILVGINAEIAQTIVQLGLDLSEIETMANLQRGLEVAFRFSGLGIQRLKAQPTAN